MSFTPAVVTQPPPRRHALGLPAGSIRALLALSVLVLLWLIALRHIPGMPGSAVDVKLPNVFIYLQILMVLMLAHFFAAHGHTIKSTAAERSPLGLPRGSVRFLLLAGYLGLAFFLYRIQPEFEYPSTGNFVLLLLLLISAFFLGHVLTVLVRGVSGGVLPAWFQDVQAWVAILAMIALGIILIIQLFINPSVSLEQRLDVPVVESILSALVGLYFGARS
jgi:hypothetical protein